MGSSLRTGQTGPPWRLAVGLVGVVGLGLVVLDGRSSLGPIAVVCSALQVALAYTLLRTSAQPISLTSAFALTWIVTYTYRLAQITLAPDPRYHHPAILAASDSYKSWIWVLTTMAFFAFGVGVVLARRLGFGAAKTYSSLELPRHTLLSLFYVFLGLSYALALSGVSSGFLGNVSQFYLFVIAYASYKSAEARRSVGPELAVVLVASLLGVLLGFKEFAVLPVVSWFVGQLAGRRRLLSVGSLAVVLIGSFFYVGIQAQRAAEVLGENHGFLPALNRGLTDYDLVTGTYLHKQGSAIPLNVLAAMGSRLTGVDALFVLDARVPEVIPFQRGRTIWEPLLSIVPGTNSFTSPELSTLSLGRYTTENFWSLSPNTDTSSQPLTIVGDFWLNFGSIGIMVGLVAFGMLYEFIDLKAPVSSATTAGLFAYAAIPLLEIERNVAYLLVTGGIRYAFGFLILRELRRLSAGTRRRPVTVGVRRWMMVRR